MMTSWREATDVENLFLAREASFAFHGARLRFELARSVFASAGIDPGSALLLRHLQTRSWAGGERVLDLGCGHGTLGIVLQALDPDRRIVSVDRDALACRFTARNVAGNGLSSEHHHVVGSLDFDRILGSGPFDLIVSNIPGKAGERAVRHFVETARRLGGPGSRLGLVVVKPLTELLSAAVERAGLDVVVATGNKAYHVLIAEIGAAPASEPPVAGFAEGVYDRDRVTFSSGSASWEARTVSGLGEFDTLSYPTLLLRSALRGVRAAPSVVVDPGQGHRAVIAARAGCPPSVLLSRDLLALEASRRCLLDAGEPAPDLVHDVTIDALGAGIAPDLIVAHADDKVHAPWFFDQVKRMLDRLEATSAESRDLVLTGRASLLGRVEAEVLRRRKGHVAEKESQRGCRALRFRLR